MNRKHVVMSTEQLRDLHVKELEILRCVIDAINQLGLTYFCVGGTALGAVKYKGFIPWDDDIDIAMPRKDFMIFMQKGQKILPSHLFLQSVYSEKHYFLGVAKVRDKTTTYFDFSTAALDVCHGIFIDIFPIDGYSPEKSKINTLQWKLRFNKITWSNYYKPDHFTLPQYAVGIISRLLLAFESPNTSCRKNEELLMKEDYDMCDKVFMRTETFDKSIFGSGSVGQFCNLKVALPQKIDEYLQLCYGDITFDPPLSKQYPHHFALAIDCHSPYYNLIFKKGELSKK